MINGVHVHRISLDCSDDEIGMLRSYLDTGETDRAEHFRNRTDENRFVVARGTLRRLIGEYLGLAPMRVSLGVLPGGKPVVTGRGLHFNLSHSGETAVYVFADCKVGIDVERIASDTDMSRVAAHFFHPDEARTFERTCQTERDRYFFRTWVRKEAYLKATGQGFVIDPARLMISGDDSHRVTIRDDDGGYWSDERFTVLDLRELDGHVAALAIEGSVAEESISYFY
jgi:4'-phosphopantetheinyl transferase